MVSWAETLMTERRLNNMRFWGLLAGKLAVSAAISYGLLALINSIWSTQIYLPKYNWKASRFGFDLTYTLVVGVWFLISCAYGHGTLKQEELQISGLENPEWTESGDPWQELCASMKDTDERS